MAATQDVTREARTVPPARPTSPPSTTRPGSSTTQTEATPTRCARSSRNAEDAAEPPATAAWTASAAVGAGNPWRAASARTAAPPAGFATAANSQVDPLNAKNWPTADTGKDYIIPDMLKSLMNGAPFQSTVAQANSQLQNVLNTGTES
jgi:hypothetical protein